MSNLHERHPKNYMKHNYVECFPAIGYYCISMHVLNPKA